MMSKKVTDMELKSHFKASHTEEHISLSAFGCLPSHSLGIEGMDPTDTEMEILGRVEGGGLEWTKSKHLQNKLACLSEWCTVPPWEKVPGRDCLEWIFP